LELSISSNLVEDGIITERLNFDLYLPSPKQYKSNQYSFTEIQQRSDKKFTPDFMYESEEDLPENPHHHWRYFEGSVEETIVYKIFNLFRNRIYRFHAERLNIHSCPLGESSELKPDASNLPEVLHVLQNLNPPRFSRFNHYVSIIFPQIEEVSVRPENSTLEIMVWSIEAAKNEREDLAFPLSACGTGISQVLAILYVVLTSQEPRTIIIDEPQSFLHPGAAKKLVEILREQEFAKHQYFIATHSPMIIAAANYPNVVKLRYEICETKAQVIESENIKEQRSLVNDLGISFSDAFGSDNVLWVEGQTEELCFPEILKMNGRHLGGTQILRVNAPSDFRKDKFKHAELLFAIYRRIGGEGSLFTPMIGLVLDRDKLTDEQIKTLKENSRCQDEEGKTRYMAKFLERRMYENYLLQSEAIADILNEIFNDKDELRGKCLTSTEIQEWLDKKKQVGWLEKDNKKGKDTYQNGISESDWENKVDGATLLEDLFREFSADEYGVTLVPFDKTKHNPKLTKWLLNNKPECLSELSNLLKKVLDGEETG
jgi:AAA15 family ATPase/GTPase